MTPQQIALVQASAGHIMDWRVDIAQSFYQHLFAANPQLRSIFPAGLAQLERKFVDELNFIAESIADFPRFVERIRGLGGRHSGYGVRARDFMSVREALLSTFGDVLGPIWTPEVNTAWMAAYDIVIEVMLLGGSVLNG